MLYDQLDKLTSRSRLLQRALTTFYVAVGVFVANSVAIGVVAFSGARFGWVPVAMGLVGASFLFYGSMLLIFEARLALSTTHAKWISFGGPPGVSYRKSWSSSTRHTMCIFERRVMRHE